MCHSFVFATVLSLKDISKQKLKCLQCQEIQSSLSYPEKQRATRSKPVSLIPLHTREVRLPCATTVIVCAVCAPEENSTDHKSFVQQKAT